MKIIKERKYCIMLKLKTEQVQEIWQVQLYDVFAECESRTLIPVGYLDKEQTLLFLFTNCIQVFGNPVKPELILKMLIENKKIERKNNISDNVVGIENLKQKAVEIERSINKNIFSEFDVLKSLEDLVSMNVTLQLLEEKVTENTGI